MVWSGAGEGLLIVGERCKREYCAGEVGVSVGEERKPGACAARNRGAELCSAE